MDEAETLYDKIIAKVFLDRYVQGAREIHFKRDDLFRAASELGVKLPKNLGDLVYTFRYRRSLPEPIRAKAPAGEEWVIFPAGIARYCFVATKLASILPREGMAETKVPDATPGIIARYALSDEQALLAKLRYNRLIDIFTGVTCYSLQSHLRTTVAAVGQVETDEIYVGVDRRGIHYVFPVQVKRGKDTLSIVQVWQDVHLCREKFPSLIARPIAAQFMAENLIALFEFEVNGTSIAIASEKHYRLVPPEEITAGDLETYRARPE